MDELVRWNNRRLVLHLFIAAICIGVIEGLLELTDHPPRWLGLAETIALNFIIFYWIVMDAKIRNYTTSVFFKLMVVIFGVIALFYYIIRNRGIRAGLRSFAYAIGLAAGMIVVGVIALWLTSEVVRLFT